MHSMLDFVQLREIPQLYIEYVLKAQRIINRLAESTQETRSNVNCKILSQHVDANALEIFFLAYQWNQRVQSITDEHLNTMFVKEREREREDMMRFHLTFVLGEMLSY